MWHVRFSGEKKRGALNASVHDEAANYGDRVCHLILCSFHHNLPHYVQRKNSLEAISPRTAAKNITQRSTYGLFQHFATQTAYGLTATILKLEECKGSLMYSSRSGCVYVNVVRVSECVTCRAAVILCTKWRLTGCIQEHTHTKLLKTHAQIVIW